MKAILRLLLLSCTLGPTSACAQTHTRAAGTPAPQAPLAPRVLGSGFQVGDRILLKVEGDSQFSDTFTVGPGPGLTLPVIGEIPLVGVRRADVEPYMSRELARYLKDPVVRAKALDRKSTRLNSSHSQISYAVFCLKKKKKKNRKYQQHIIKTIIEKKITDQIYK